MNIRTFIQHWLAMWKKWQQFRSFLHYVFLYFHQFPHQSIISISTSISVSIYWLCNGTLQLMGSFTIVNVWLCAWEKRWASVPTEGKYDWILRPGYFLSLFMFHSLSLATFRIRKKWEKYPCLPAYFFFFSFSFVLDDSKTKGSLYHRGKSQTGPCFKTKELFRLTRKKPSGQWVLS